MQDSRLDQQPVTRAAGHAGSSSSRVPRLGRPPVIPSRLPARVPVLRNWVADVCWAHVVLSGA
jgi:hypothetical protein